MLGNLNKKFLQYSPKHKSNGVGFEQLSCRHLVYALVIGCLRSALSIFLSLIHTTRFIKEKKHEKLVPRYRSIYPYPIKL